VNDDDRSLHFLLSASHLSAARREHILDRVNQQSSSGRRRRRVLGLVAGARPVGAAGARSPGGGRRGRGTDPAARIPKGAPGAAILQARCANAAAPGRCSRGDRILFEIDGAGAAPGFLAAYAEDRTGGRIWYFPRADGRLAPVPVRSGHVVMEEVVRVGAEHAPGRYAVHLLLFDRAVVDRSAVLDGREKARATATIALEVLP
jgi:hypothetical protein